uniref:Serpentine receptor class gamma n=1 Tax=Parastrongyloides trichosuri TaxID=131310 RepID=A0A0N4ZAJ5_PARTI
MTTLFYILSIILSIIIVIPTLIVFYGLVKLTGYHNNFKYLLSCVLLNTALYFITIICCYTSYIIVKDKIILTYNTEIRYVFTYGGVHFVQIYAIIERIIAILYISKYETFNPNIPYLGIFLLLLGYLTYGVQRAIIMILNLYEEIILIEVNIFMLFAFIIYIIIYRKHKFNRIHKDSFVNKNLSTKYQYIENQKTYSIVSGLLLLFVIFTFTTNMIKILSTSFLVDFLQTDVLNFIFFMGVFCKTAATIGYLLWKIPKLLIEVKRITRIGNNRERVENIEGTKNSTSKNTIIKQGTQNDYFNQYGDQW